MDIVFFPKDTETCHFLTECFAVQSITSSGPGRWLESKCPCYPIIQACWCEFRSQVRHCGRRDRLPKVVLWLAREDYSMHTTCGLKIRKENCSSSISVTATRKHCNKKIVSEGKRSRGRDLEQRSTSCVFACSLPFWLSATSLLAFPVQDAWLVNGVSHSGLGSATSASNQDNPPGTNLI